MVKFVLFCLIALASAGCVVAPPFANVEACILCARPTHKIVIVDNRGSCPVQVFQNGVTRVTVGVGSIGRIHLPPPVFDDQYSNYILTAKGACGSDSRNVSVSRHNLATEEWQVRPFK